MKIYISGKITGLPYDEVVEKFKQAEAQISAYQYAAVSPLDNGCAVDDPWEKQMKESIGLLLACDAIYLLGDWKDSPGARIEEFIARERGMLILDQPEFAYYKAKH